MKGRVIAIWALFARTVKDSLGLWRTAIWLPLLAVIPEFIQHVAEIKLGMFAGPDAFRALQNDPLRWAFGFLKIAGLFAAIFLSARYWARQQGKAVAWRQFGIALAINAAATAAFYGLDLILATDIAPIVNLVLSIATLPLLTMLVGPLLGDREMTLGAAFRRGWLPVLRMVLLAAVIWLPLSLLHRLDHTAAFGKPAALVWLLMAWDAILVGVMACWAGTALHHGYHGRSDQP